MSTNTPGSFDDRDTLSTINAAIEQKRAIPYGVDMPDKEMPQVLWSQYGLIDTNEIAVIVRCGTEVHALKAPSELIHPSMADRIFGIDSIDAELSGRLADELWSKFSGPLKAAAART